MPMLILASQLHLATEIDKATHMRIPPRILWGFVFLRRSLAARPLYSSVPRM